MCAAFCARHRSGALIQRMKYCSFFLLLFVAVACHHQTGKVLGKAPAGDIRTVLAVRAGDTPPVVTLTGTMTEKCPVAGCWFRLTDGTGTIKVDTQAAGFVVADVPLETRMTVAGKIVESGDEIIIEASGVRY